MGKVLVYDLTSENRRVLRNTQFYDTLRNVRVKATRLLHSLGVQCTESVILIANNNQSNIQNVIDIVNREYERVLEDIRSALDITLPSPIIRVLDITQEQYDIFVELAQRRLRENIDMQIDRVSLIIELNRSIEEGRNIRNMVISLRRLKKEWIRIKQQCRALDIPLEDEIGYLIELIDQAIDHLSR